MPAPDYCSWRIIGHNGVATAGCSITEPIMQRPDGTITLLSLGPFGGLSRDTREVVEQLAEQGSLTLFPPDVTVPMPTTNEAVEDPPMILSISYEFYWAIKNATGDPPADSGGSIDWIEVESTKRWIVCFSESKVEFLRDPWGETLCKYFDRTFVRAEDRSWDRLERLARFGLEIARGEGLREHLYRRYCMAMLCRDDGRPPERASRIFNGFVKHEFHSRDWTTFKATIEELYQDFLLRRRAYFLSLDNDKTLCDYLESRKPAIEPTQTRDDVRRRRSESQRNRCGLTDDVRRFDVIT